MRGSRTTSWSGRRTAGGEGSRSQSGSSEEEREGAGRREGETHRLDAGDGVLEGLDLVAALERRRLVVPVSGERPESAQEGRRGRERKGGRRRDAPEALCELLLADVDATPLVRLRALLAHSLSALLELAEVVQERRRVGERLGVVALGARRAALAVEVLLLEGAVDLVADVLLVLAEAVELVGEALLDVRVEGLLARGGDGRGRGGLGLEVVDEGLGELGASVGSSGSGRGCAVRMRVRSARGEEREREEEGRTLTGWLR